MLWTVNGIAPNFGGGTGSYFARTLMYLCITMVANILAMIQIYVYHDCINMNDILLCFYIRINHI